jgi:histidine decarboxylase
VLDLSTPSWPRLVTGEADRGDLPAYLDQALAALTEQLEQARPTNVGYPAALDFDYTPLAPLLCRQPLNNVGDPYHDGAGPDHTRAFERQVVAMVADLMRAPHRRRWGYVTTGGSESNLYALHHARARLRNAVLYHSEAAHYSVAKAADLLALPTEVIRADGSGEIDYHDLAEHLAPHRHRPAIVVANIGTTMTEAIDDVRRIHQVLDGLAIRRRYVHADAALAGIPLALLEPAQRPGFDLADGATSVAISGHKFLGTPFPCGVVVVKTARRRVRVDDVPYTASPDTTITGSRSGHAPLLLWYALARHGLSGLRQRAQACRDLADYTRARLADIGWEAYRAQPHAFTVVLKTPPPGLSRPWVLAGGDGWSHIVCMPGITRRQIDLLTEDIAHAASGTGGPAEGEDTP